MTQSFDSTHAAALQPPDPRLCAPGSHELTKPAISVADLPNVVVRVECGNCDAVAWVEITAETIGKWEL